MMLRTMSGDLLARTSVAEREGDLHQLGLLIAHLICSWLLHLDSSRLMEAAGLVTAGEEPTAAASNVEGAAQEGRLDRAERLAWSTVRASSHASF